MTHTFHCQFGPNDLCLGYETGYSLGWNPLYPSLNTHNSLVLISIFRSLSKIVLNPSFNTPHTVGTDPVTLSLSDKTVTVREVL